MGRKRDCIPASYSSGDYPIDVQGWINTDFKSKFYAWKETSAVVNFYIY